MIARTGPGGGPTQRVRTCILLVAALLGPSCAGEREPGEPEAAEPVGRTAAPLATPPATWVRVEPGGLTERRGAGAAYDSVRGETVIFGGDDGTLRGDTWGWNGTTLARRASAGPPPRSWPAMAWDPATATVFLYGGAEGTRDVWSWNGASWAPRTTSSTPGLAQASALTFRDKVLLVGLVGYDAVETWEWNGAGFTQRAPAAAMVAPSSNCGSLSLGVDPIRDRAVLVGDGVFEWDGASWTKVLASPGIPACARPGYVGGTLTFVAPTSPAGNMGAWSWNGGAFTPLTVASPMPGRGLFAASMDSDRDRLVLIGGALGASSTSFGIPTSEVWEWSGGAFALQAASGAPGLRVHPVVAYDPVGARELVYAGGSDKLWSYVAGTWTQLSARACSSLEPDGAWDAARGLLLAQCDGSVNPVWDGATWSSPSGPWMIAGMAYDPARAVTVAVFNGSPAATWEYDSTGWHTVPSATGTSLLYGRLSVTYDGAHGNVLAVDEREDTHVYDGAQWTKVTTPKVLPGGAGAYGTLVYNPRRQRPLLVPPNDRSTLYEWDGTQWTTLLAGGDPPPPATPYTYRADLIATYDVARDRVVAYGGSTDMYELVTRRGGCGDASDCDPGDACTDGVCCETADCPSCQACNVPGFEGTCAPALGLSHAPECPAPSVCGADGACGGALGVACTSGGDCSTGFCVDGGCCDGACDGGCDRCDLSGKVGICSVVSWPDPGAAPACAPFVCDGVRPACPDICRDDWYLCAGQQYGLTRCVAGVCVAKVENGVACAVPDACLSGYCSGGVCCDTPCDGLCEACTEARTGVATGACAPIIDGDACGTTTCTASVVSGRLCLGGICQDATLDCAPFSCTQAGACLAACDGDEDCAPSSRCVGGTCAGTTPNGGACDAASSCGSGHCVAGVCCDEACDEACVSCLSENKADGSRDGICGPARASTPCGATSCDATSGEVQGLLCADDGSCAARTFNCVPYLCDASGVACRTRCANDDDCAAGFVCDEEKCHGVLPLGATCLLDEQCTSGSCTDGVCCDARCRGSCERCDTPDDLGACVPVPAGEQRLGSSCAPYLCDGRSGACADTCEDDDDCAAGLPCVRGACQTLELGHACSEDGECASEHCVDGVCCDTRCDGCRACSKAAKGYGDDGACEAVLSGKDPHDECDAEPAETCAEDGTCDGRGGCRLHQGGTACSDDTSCLGDYSVGSVCDGRGECITAPPGGYPCAPYRCIDDRCSIPCGQCRNGYECDDGTCRGVLALGDDCQEDGQCRSAHCVDGVCCDGACSESCSACDLPGSVGECSFVPAGKQPHGERPSCRGEGTACAGTCDGKGDCSYPDGECDADCEDGWAFVGACKLGHCAAPEAPVTCGRFACDAAGEHCLSTCKDDDDCAPGFECRSADCAPQPNGRCKDDVTLDVVAENRVVHCVAYKCAVDRCKKSCTSSDDCQAGFSCTGEGTCVLDATIVAQSGAPGARPSADDGCGCRVPRRQPGSGWLVATWFLALGLRRTRRMAWR